MNNYADVTMVLDRSGSMARVREDMIEGVNEFIKSQREDDIPTYLTLLQFNTETKVVREDEDMSDVELLGSGEFWPKGFTALLDAVGEAIDRTGERLSNIPEHDRPENVIFVIMTDGHENASSEYTKEQIKEKIEHQQDVYDWEFVFLGANQDAFAEAGAIGIRGQTVANYTPQNTRDVYGNVSKNITSAKKGGDMSWDASQRESMTKEEK